MMAGKIIRSPFVDMRYAPLPGRIAFAVVISAKAAPKAVDRNRVRRRGRAILGKLGKKLIPGHAIAFFCKKGTAELPFSELETTITSLLTKASLL